MKINQIIDKAIKGEKITRDECIFLLGLDDDSPEVLKMRSVASEIVRKRNGNSGYIFAQIGLSCAPCEGNCSFCSFAKSHTMLPRIDLDDEQIIQKVRELEYTGDVYGIYLMMMHTFDLERFLHCVELVRKELKGPVRLFSNVGDTSYEDFVRMKKAGIDGVYHCWRLGEGRDTDLDPEDRKRTIMNAKKAGLEILDALEPIGTEHTPEELADHILFSRDMGLLQSGAMKRINVPGTPFEGREEISGTTMSKCEAVMVLAFSSMERMPIMGTHEPADIVYTSGANMVSAESGVNPRDTVEDTSRGRGWDTIRCRALLKRTGFERIVLGDGSTIDI